MEFIALPLGNWARRPRPQRVPPSRLHFSREAAGTGRSGEPINASFGLPPDCHLSFRQHQLFHRGRNGLAPVFMAEG
jgi:hypothetical protein